MSEFTTLPRHVAVIMDGNRRWARQHKLQIALGHRTGVETLRAIIRESSDLGIGALSLFAFSTENWSRSPAEVSALMQLLLEFFSSEIDELDENRVCIRILGVKEALPEAQRAALEAAEARTRSNGGLKLNIAINYGSRDELVRAVRRISSLVRDGQMEAQDITEKTLSDHLDTAGIDEVDLLIRTSGEMRLSNFLLYQCAYAEFVFTPVLWPDFDLKCYHDALHEYERRQRRYGG